MAFEAINLGSNPSPPAREYVDNSPQALFSFYTEGVLKNKYVLYGAALVAVVVLVGALLFLTPAQKTADEGADGLEAVRNAAANSPAVAPNANPLNQVTPAENPIEKTNPFKNDYKNPFE